MTRFVKRGGKLWIRVFPDKPVTKKPLEVRMGSGKGNVEYWVALIQPGAVLYEIEGVNEERRARRSSWRRPSCRFKTTFVTRRYGACDEGERIRAMDAETRQKELTGLLREQFNLRMQKATGQLPSTRQMQAVRRDIARVKTVMNEKTG